MTSREGRGGCEPIKMDDGSVLLVNLKPGASLTEEDREVLRVFHHGVKTGEWPGGWLAGSSGQDGTDVSGTQRDTGQG